MYDSPAFKLLAPNDTAHAPGHQGGIVVPKDIEDYFPDIVGATSTTTPTADVAIRAELIIDGVLKATVDTRYQYQTWGGKRSPERRLTGSLGPIRTEAVANDMVLFSRDLENPELMRLELIRQGTDTYDKIRTSSSNKRWGIVPGLPTPAKNSDIRAEDEHLEQLLTDTFHLTDSSRPTIEKFQKFKARNAAFRRKLLKEYGKKCLASGEIIETLTGHCNLDAAHIMPVEDGGSDDVRNGLLLSKDLHWAFDRGLFTIGSDYVVTVSKNIDLSKQGEPLQRISNNKLDFGTSVLRPHPDALSWHMANRYIG